MLQYIFSHNLFAHSNHAVEDHYVDSFDLEQTISSLSMQIVLWAGAVILLLTFVAMLTKKRKSLKAPLYWIIAGVTLLSTFTLIGSTLYLNINSDSKGPVHRHADFEVWACGNQLELRDPSGFLSNKIGTSVVHEHNDQRIHIEGVVVDEEKDASLGKFMHVIGGSITSDYLRFPLNDDQLLEDDIDGDGPSSNISIDEYIHSNEDGRFAEFSEGKCGDQDAEVQVFLYTFDEQTDTYSQTKLEDPASHSIADEEEVPPGDCIIMEFDVPKDKTDKLCNQYGVRDMVRCREFGVEETVHCEIWQTNYRYGAE